MCVATSIQKETIRQKKIITLILLDILTFGNWILSIVFARLWVGNKPTKGCQTKFEIVRKVCIIESEVNSISELILWCDVWHISIVTSSLHTKLQPLPHPEPGDQYITSLFNVKASTVRFILLTQKRFHLIIKHSIHSDGESFKYFVLEYAS